MLKRFVSLQQYAAKCAHCTTGNHINNNNNLNNSHFYDAYLTSKGEHTALYKVNNNVSIKTSKMIDYVVIIVYSLHVHAHTHNT